MESKRQWMATNRLKTRSPFKDLFPVEAKTLNNIGEHMKDHGYDESQPIVIWDRTGDEGKHAFIVIDGYTRLQAAKDVSLSPVYVARVKFPDEQTALDYAVHNQRDRRNMTDAELWRCIQYVDKRKEQGGDRRSEDFKSSGEPLKEKSADKTAKILGTSSTKVKKARTVIDHAGKETKQAVASGEMSINKAYEETQEKRKGKGAKVKPGYKHTETYEVSDAMQFAEIAVSQLERIPRNDHEREQAFDRVYKWLVNRNASPKDLESLKKLHDTFFQAMQFFMHVQNRKGQKRKWKEYLTELHNWTGNLEALTEHWLKNLEKKE